jgi:hypothetical protein
MRNLRMRGLLNMGFDKRQKPNHLAISPYEIPLWAMTRTPYSCNGNYAYVNEFPVLVYGLQLVCYKWQYVLLGWKKFGWIDVWSLNAQKLCRLNMFVTQKDSVAGPLE